MASIWVESLGRSFEEALHLLAAAVRDCSDDLWETPMWEVSAPNPAGEGGELAIDHAQRQLLAERWVRRRSTPWSVAWHVLEGLDYDLTGEFGAWAPPPPFTGHPHWRDLPSLPAAWSRSETLDYVEYCRQRVRDALSELTDELAARPLPSTHRYGGQPHAWIITALVGHTTEHASQIRQFITTATASQ